MTKLGLSQGLNLTPAAWLAEHPRAEVVRLYRTPTQTLPAWDSATLAPYIAANVDIHLSFKVYDLAAVKAWLSAMPKAWLGTLFLTYAHEPEQQDGGDPTPAVFRARWAELGKALDSHPMRPRIILVPVFTHYRWENAGDGRQYWPTEAAQYIDAVGWDVYSNLSTGYRPPADMLALIRAFSAEVGKPYLIGEWGAFNGGPACADWMADFVSAVRHDGALAAMWWNGGTCDLIANNRQAERGALKALTGTSRAVTEAVHAGYLEGSAAGRNQGLTEAADAIRRLF